MFHHLLNALSDGIFLFSCLLIFSPSVSAAAAAGNEGSWRTLMLSLALSLVFVGRMC